MFEDDGDTLTGLEVGHTPLHWSRAWDRLGPFTVSLLLIAAAAALLTVGVKLVLASGTIPAVSVVSDTPDSPVRPSPPAKPAPVPVATVTVHTTGTALNERSGPSTYNPIHSHLANGSTVGVMCQVFGQKLTGAVATSAWWEVDVHGWYISDSNLTWHSTRPAVPWCGVSTHLGVTATTYAGNGTPTIRATPSSTGHKVGTIAAGTSVTVTCRSWGTVVAGTANWSKLGDGRYVSDASIHWAPEQPFIPWCGQAPQSVPPATVAAFITQAVKPAQASMDKYHVPASVTIAQAILESGSGVSTLTRVDHSYFGMKCFGNPGSVALGCRDYATHECDTHGACHATDASFRAYRTDADSYADHGLSLSTASRYHAAFVHPTDADAFAKALQKGGYATSTHYATNLIAVMHRYNLYRYDHDAANTPTTPLTHHAS